MKDIKSHFQFSIPVCFIFLVMIFGFIYFPADAEAKVSAGTYLTEIGSKKVCGDKLCDEPLSITQKINDITCTKCYYHKGYSIEDPRDQRYDESIS